MFWAFGTREHMLPFLKCILRKFQNFKKFEEKVPRVRLTFYVVTKSFHREPTFFVSCVKKTIFGAKKGFSRVFFLSFYTCHKKCRFFVKLDVRT